MNADGSNKERLTHNHASDRHPIWSPDGEHVAFRSSRNGSEETYVVNANGSGLALLTHNSASEGEISWSPDGEYIAFNLYWGRNSAQVYHFVGP